MSTGMGGAKWIGWCELENIDIIFIAADGFHACGLGAEVEQGWQHSRMFTRASTHAEASIP